MKSKIASILGLIIPLSIALMLSAFLGCGGGGNPYGNSQAYDGSWDLNYQGYALPAVADGAPGPVVCTELPTTIVIDHGFGKVTELIYCINAALGTDFKTDIDVTITPDPTGITGTVKAQVTGGATIEGICINRNSCGATSFKMTRL